MNVWARNRFAGPAQWNRRRVLIGAGITGVAAGLAGLAGIAYCDRSKAPLALVYRGPAACSGCAEAVAALLRGTPTGFRTEFCGPEEEWEISADSLAEAVVYAQPGGGYLAPAWRRMRDHAETIRDFVDGGGTYLGFCLGAYLAAADPGFALLPGRVDRYIDAPQASVQDEDDAIVAVRWRGKPRHMYFQDGPSFRLRADAPATVLATYDTGAPAAVVVSHGAGRVGVVGPHPEADESWYRDAGLTNPDGIRFDLGHDLIETTISNRLSTAS